jgi:hypothetical protein
MTWSSTIFYCCILQPHIHIYMKINGAQFCNLICNRLLSNVECTHNWQASIILSLFFINDSRQMSHTHTYVRLNRRNATPTHTNGLMSLAVLWESFPTVKCIIMHSFGEVYTPTCLMPRKHHLISHIIYICAVCI